MVNHHFEVLQATKIRCFLHKVGSSKCEYARLEMTGERCSTTWLVEWAWAPKHVHEQFKAGLILSTRVSSVLCKWWQSGPQGWQAWSAHQFVKESQPTDSAARCKTVCDDTRANQGGEGSSLYSFQSREVANSGTTPHKGTVLKNGSKKAFARTEELKRKMPYTESQCFFCWAACSVTEYRYCPKFIQCVEAKMWFFLASFHQNILE